MAVSAGACYFRRLGHRLVFLTLTTAPGQGAKLAKKFREFRERLRRLGYGLGEYLVVRTTEGNGVLHVVHNWGYIPRSKMQEIWQKIAPGSWNVDVRELRGSDRHIAWYLGRYLKGQSSRLSYSRGWIGVGWRAQYRRLARAAFFTYLPKLTSPPLCIMAYTRWLYFSMQQQFISAAVQMYLPQPGAVKEK